VTSVSRTTSKPTGRVSLPKPLRVFLDPVRAVTDNRHSMSSPAFPALNWSPWRPLDGCWVDPGLTSPGLYRIRRIGRENLDYIGQTGLRLRQRLAMLRSVYGPEMPYRDPHTAAPALWAQRQLGGEDYEASTSPVDGDPRWRKALECIALALYRQEHRCSPTFNFGRMPDGYRISSANNARIVAAGKRFRGGLTVEGDSSHLPSICPVGLLEGDPCAGQWAGHQWSPWVPLTAGLLTSRDSVGVYGIRGADTQIVYIGEGYIGSRLVAHHRSAGKATTPQGRALAAAQPLTCSWAIDANWQQHQRLELENDLIAACVLAKGSPPAAQFCSLSPGP
jgi:hypothetical protein